MNPSNSSSRMYPPAPNYEEEPPVYGSYGDSPSYLSDNESPSAPTRRHNGATMRLLPTTGTGVDDEEEYDDEDLHGNASTYQYQSEYPDDEEDDGLSRYVRDEKVLKMKG